MSSRDRTREILDIKQREARWKMYSTQSFQQLRDHWLKHRQDAGCLPDFYIIRLVTLLEVFTRRNIQELIDHDKQFTERAIELCKTLKFDFALVRDLQGRMITLGDVISHQVPLNSFGQILNYFDALLGKSVRPLLERTENRWETEVTKQASGPIITNFQALASALNRMFEVRHILCHEIPSAIVYETADIDEFFNQAIQFVESLHWLLTFEKHGLVPLTQTDMNIAAGETFHNAESEMANLVGEIQSRVKDIMHRDIRRDTDEDTVTWRECFDNAQKSWLVYRDLHCDFETYLNQGGTIRPLLWASEAERLTKLRIDDLKTWLKRDSDK
jgi:uncharacterized protein YecT (DUF1311 family)